eukprot:4831-Hanusia_phi.AAC.3
MFRIEVSELLQGKRVAPCPSCTLKCRDSSRLVIAMLTVPVQVGGDVFCRAIRTVEGGDRGNGRVKSIDVSSPHSRPDEQDVAEKYIGILASSFFAF